MDRPEGRREDQAVPRRPTSSKRPNTSPRSSASRSRTTTRRSRRCCIAPTRSRARLRTRLRAAGIAYVVLGGVGFYERREVKDALSYLKLILNPHDDIALRRVINVPARGIGKGVMDALEARRCVAGRSSTCRRCWSGCRRTCRAELAVDEAGDRRRRPAADARGRSRRWRRSAT